MLRGFLELGGSFCRVACQEEAIVGFVIAIQEGPRAHVITIDVATSARRAGVGTALLEVIESALAANGVQRMTLETAVNNQPAVAFWEKHGYRRIATYPRYYLHRHDAYLMTKRLG